MKKQTTITLSPEEIMQFLKDGLERLGFNPINLEINLEIVQEGAIPYSTHDCGHDVPKIKNATFVDLQEV